MNALTEPQVIEALYEASRAGTRIDLVVRGTCALRPGIPGMSDNVTVRSIIGRFLEHPRGGCFGEGRKARVFLSSADWMERNLFHRVEIAFPVLDHSLLESLHSDMQLYLDDRADAWMLQPDGTYVHASPPEDGTPALSAQASLLRRYTT
jgi:polyphosphate kinase